MSEKHFIFTITKRLIYFFLFILMFEARSSYCESYKESPEYVQYENEFFSISYLGMHWDEVYGPYIQFSFRNKTEQNIMLSIDYLTINRRMCNVYYADYIQAGGYKTEQVAVGMDKEYLLEDSIYSVIPDIWIYADDEKQTDLFHEKMYFFPLGREEADKYTIVPYGDTLFNQLDIYLGLIQIEQYLDGSFGAILWLQNSSDKEIVIDINNIIVYDKKKEVFFSKRLTADSYSIEPIFVELDSLNADSMENKFVLEMEVLDRTSGRVSVLVRENIEINM